MAELPVAVPATVTAFQKISICESEMTGLSVRVVIWAGAWRILALIVFVGPTLPVYWAFVSDILTSTRLSKLRE